MSHIIQLLIYLAEDLAMCVVFFGGIVAVLWVGGKCCEFMERFLR